MAALRADGVMCCERAKAREEFDGQDAAQEAELLAAQTRGRIRDPRL